MSNAVKLSELIATSIVKSRYHGLMPQSGRKHQTLSLQILNQMVNRFGSPTYVYRGEVIRGAVTTIQAFVKKKKLNLHVHYAMKANSNLTLLGVLKDLGVGVDLVSIGEWKRADLVGFDYHHRIFSGLEKKKSDLEPLMALPGAGVRAFHIESVEEFECLAQLAREHRKVLAVAFRFNPDVDAKTHPKISTGRVDDKFGLSAEVILGLVEKTKSPMYSGINIEGMSVHIGSQIFSLAPYRNTFKKLNHLKFAVEHRLERRLTYLDLGGGMGVDPLGEKVFNWSGYFDLVGESFSSDTELVIEPGRSLVAEAGFLIAQVVAIKKDIGFKSPIVVIDAAMNDLMRPALYDAVHPITVVGRSGRKEKMNVVGGVCESSCHFGSHLLPSSLKPGDFVVIGHAGAYGASMASQYNTRPRPCEIWWDQNKNGEPLFKVVRRRETFQDLIEPELMP